MRIVCPSCQAAYEVPDAILASGPRPVRCARCQKEWTPPAPPPLVVQPAVQPVAPPPPESPPPAAPPLAAPPPAALPAEAGAPGGRVEPRLSALRPRSGARAAVADAAPDSAGEESPLPPAPRPPLAPAVIGWVLSVALLAGIGWSAVKFRAEVMTAWPPSERVYLAVGLQ